MPQISIIVPVFNAERYLEATLACLRNQLLEDIEIIAVDDFSEDKSLNILLKHAKEDERVKIISFDENKSQNQARKAGVMAANGKYIMFVDADDMLDERACSYLLSEMKSEKVDVLHFGTEPINCNGVEKSRINMLIKDANPDSVMLTKKDNLLKHYFSRPRSGHLWAKLFNADVVKKAFEQVEDLVLSIGEDLYAIFIIMYYAQSYKGINASQFKFYKYYYGRGGFGRTEDFKFYEKICSEVNISEAIKRFLLHQDKFKNFEEYYCKIRNQYFNVAYNKFIQADLTEQSKYFDCLISYWGNKIVIEQLVTRLNWYNPLIVAKMLKDVSFLKKIKKTQIKTIGAFYYRLSNGGAERSFSKLCGLWSSMGYNVVLFTDAEPTPDDYYVPENVIRVVLPDAKVHIGSKYVIRMAALLNAIETYQIDAFVYFAWISASIFWDMLTIKSAGVQFIIRCANIYTQFFNDSSERFFELPSIYSFADCVTVLSRADYAYWSAYCENVRIIQNPLTFNIDDINTSPLNSNTILWVARFSHEKRPEDALKIVKLVVKKIPNVKLQIVGTNSTNIDHKTNLINYVKDNNLEENVEFVGFTTEVIEYYKNADVKLITSKYEGWCNTISEAMMHGLPLVCYDMPYLEMLRRYDKGMIKVPQGDIAAAADAIIEILSDSNKKAEMGMASRIAAEEMAEYDFKGTWQDIFDSVTEGKESKPKYIPTEEDIKIMLQTLNEHGENMYNKIRADRENIQKMKKELEEIKKSQETKKTK